MAGNKKVILDAGHGGLEKSKMNSGLYAESGLWPLSCFYDF